MKVIILGLAVIFLIAVCQPSDAYPQVYTPIPTQRTRRSPQGPNQAKIHIEKEGRNPATLNAGVNREFYNDGRHSLNGHAQVSSPDLSHFNPSAGATYEYRPQKHVVLSVKPSVSKGPSGRPEGQVHAGVGIEW